MTAIDKIIVKMVNESNYFPQGTEYMLIPEVIWKMER